MKTTFNEMVYCLSVMDPPLRIIVPTKYVFDAINWYHFNTNYTGLNALNANNVAPMLFCLHNPRETLDRTEIIGS